MTGRLFVIEGSDASGKSTQLDMLCDRLARENTPFRKIVFPRYEEDSSMLARMYLSGRFGTDPSDVNAYAASVFFAVDRFASYAADWGAFYRAGGLILCHRYTTANAIHQAVKLEGEERCGFLDWLFDFEYVRMGIPKPDGVLFLDMPPAYSLELMRERNVGTQGDIHENNAEYLKKCYEVSKQCAERYGWTTVDCVRGNTLRSREQIADEIYNIVVR